MRYSLHGTHNGMRPPLKYIYLWLGRWLSRREHLLGKHEGLHSNPEQLCKIYMYIYTYPGPITLVLQQTGTGALLGLVGGQPSFRFSEELSQGNKVKSN